MNDTLFCVLMLCTPVTAAADDALVISTLGAGTLIAPVAQIDSITTRNDSLLFHSRYGVARLCHRDMAEMTLYSCDTRQLRLDALTVTYNGAEVTTVNPYFLHGVTIAIDGAHVTVANPNESEELCYVLDGQSADGSFTLDAGYKSTVTLAGLELTSQRGAAVNIDCGKRINMVVADGTTNSIADCTGGTQKACMVFKGHPEWSGAGTLNVAGRTGHGIRTKEYMQIKKSFGTLNITAAAGDGIHALQYFQMNGGTLNISGVADDGVQVEKTDDNTDEQNGQLIIKGGTINITVAGQETDCLKTDSCATITGGSITLTATGNGGRGMKIGTDLTIGLPDGDDSALTLTVGTTGAAAGSSTGGTTSPWPAPGGGGRPGGGGGGGWPPGGGGPGGNMSGQPKAIKVMGDIVLNSGTVAVSTKQDGGEGMESKKTITFNGGVMTADTYDDGINAASKITFNGGIVWSHSTGNDGIDCNGQQGFEFNGGIILSSGTRSPEEGFDCDNYQFKINGGMLIGTGGASSTPTSAKQPFSSSSISVTSGKYLCIKDKDGSVICSYRCPNTTSGTVLTSMPQYTSGTSYTVVTGATSVNNPSASYLDGVFMLGGTVTGGSTSTVTPKTK